MKLVELEKRNYESLYLVSDREKLLSSIDWNTYFYDELFKNKSGETLFNEVR